MTFFKGPPFEFFSKLQKMSIFNAFLKYAVVSSSFEIQTSPICQIEWFYQGGFDGRGQPAASPMLTSIMSGGVGISGRELYKCR